LRRADAGRAYQADGTIAPRRFDDYLDAEGVDVALLLAEYSPKVTGIQPVEDLLPVAAHNPGRNACQVYNLKLPEVS
jgi:uncharacterized protein